MKRLLIILLAVLTASCSSSSRKPTSAREIASSGQISEFDRQFQIGPQAGGLDLDKWTKAFFESPKASPQFKGLATIIVAAAQTAKSVDEVYQLILPYAGNFGNDKKSRAAYEHLAEALLSARRELRKSTASTDLQRQTLYLLQALAEDVLYVIRYRFPTAQVWQRTYVDSATARKNCVDSQNDVRTAQLAGLKAEICSGDLVLSKGGSGSSSFLARVTDYPGNFSHATAFYVEPRKGSPRVGTKGQVFQPEAFIEDGVKLREPAKEGYAGSPLKKKKMFIYRLAADAQVMSAPIMAMDQFIDGMKNRSVDVKSVAAYEYDFNFQADDHERYFCSEVPYKIYSDAQKSDGRVSNPYDPALWGRVSGSTAAFFRDFLGVNKAQFPSPSDIELNPNFELVAFSFNLEQIGMDRVDTALIDSLLLMAKTNSQLVESYAAKFKSLGNDSLNLKKTMDELVAGGFVTRQMADGILLKYGKKIPENINLKQMVFFGYLNEVLTPKVRAEFAWAANPKSDAQVIGTLELRAKIREFIETELGKLKI